MNLERVPIQVTRVCRAIPGAAMSIEEDQVFACSDWDPEDEDQVASRERRRNHYLFNHPECAAADEKYADDMAGRAQELLDAQIESDEDIDEGPPTEPVCSVCKCDPCDCS